MWCFEDPRWILQPENGSQFASPDLKDSADLLRRWGRGVRRCRLSCHRDKFWRRKDGKLESGGKAAYLLLHGTEDGEAKGAADLFLSPIGGIVRSGEKS